MKRVVWSSLVSFLLFASILASTVAQERIVGVHIGDWFKYGEITVSWNSNDPNATFPPADWEWLETMNETEWMLMSVVGGTAPYVGLQAREHFRDGTERIRSGFVVVDTGNSSQDTEITMDMTFMVIGADLNANDTIYLLPMYSAYKINETVVRTYLEPRNTNHLNMTREFSWTANETEHYFYQSMNLYWDRSTGVFVEEHVEVINQTGTYLTTWSESNRIIESNAWIVPEFPTWTSMLLPLIVLTVAVSIYKRRLLETPIR